MKIEILLPILNVVFYIILIGFYITLLYITNKKAKKLEKRQYHYIFNLISLAILITTLLTPLNQLIGYLLACAILLGELILAQRLRKISN